MARKEAAHVGEPCHAHGIACASFAIVAKKLLARNGMCLAWFAVATACVLILLSYQSAHGSAGSAPANWPRRTQLVLDTNRATLIMFAHPQCACTRAGIEELNHLLARCENHLRAQIWFYRPSSVAKEWVRSSLWRRAATIPGISLHEDVDGAQAKLFGVDISGSVLVYDTSGKLRFKGGITGSHNPGNSKGGEDMIVSISDSPSPDFGQTPVHGCSLFGDCKELLQTASR